MTQNHLIYKGVLEIFFSNHEKKDFLFLFL